MFKPSAGTEADGPLSKVLLVVSDVTEHLLHRRIEREQREHLTVFQRVMRDRVGFIEFFNEAEQIVEQVLGGTLAQPSRMMRAVHTLKGNCGIFGVTSVAEVCHGLEAFVVENDQLPSPEMLKPLEDVWQAFAARIRPMLGVKDDDIVEVPYDDLHGLLQMLASGAPHIEIASAVQRLQYEPIAARFERIAEQAQGVAARLGRGELDIVVEDGGVRLPRERWAPFWSAFVHAVRNAIDHGLEAPDERKSSGKPAHGQLRLTAAEVQGDYVIEIGDDGRGVDWEKVKQLAKTRGLAHETADDLTQAMLSDGLSTRDTVSDTSGRGVGMAALQQATTDMGGRISVTSIGGQGTTVTFRVPVRGNDQAPAMTERPGVRPSLQPPPSPKSAGKIRIIG